jgi:hypothetical protein
MSITARLRRFWWQRVRRYRYEMCQRCGRPVRVVWTASDNLWNVIESGPDGIRCVECFDRDCAEQGRALRWRPTIEHVGEPFKQP